MKKAAFLFCFSIVLTLIVSFQSSGQEAQMPQKFIVFEEHVAPADMAAFTKVQNKAFEMFDKYNFDFTFWAYRTDESSFYWVLPLQNLASLDELFAKSMANNKKMLEDGYDADKEFRDLSTGRQTVIHWSQTLSYHPSGTFGQTEGNSYCEWTFAYLKTGHDKEAAEAIKKYQAFYDGIDESYEWDVYQVMLGHDTPCWILMVRGESELALRKHEKELGEKYGGEFQKMWANFAQHVRKFENKKGWYLPKWSRNIPE